LSVPRSISSIVPMPAHMFDETAFMTTTPGTTLPWVSVTRPAIVLADEPTGNLDSENSALVLNMFQELNYRFNQTIIMITHNPEAAAMCKRIVQMRDGHIVEQSPTVRL